MTRSGTQSNRAFVTRAARVLVARPALWPTAARQVARMVSPQWWRRPPFLPLPDAAYLRFRLETQYGHAAPVDPNDLITYLEWCRSSDR